MSTLSENEKEKYLNELFEFLKLPSISADSRYNQDVILPTYMRLKGIL